MTTNSRHTRLFVGILAISMLFAGCDRMYGRAYVAFKVTSDPPGATVYSIMQHKSLFDDEDHKFAKDRFGTTPTGVLIMWFARSAPGAGKVGVRVTKDGCEPYEVFFEAKNWYGTEQEARRHVTELTVSLKQKEPVVPHSDQQRAVEEHRGTSSPNSPTKSHESYRMHRLAHYTFEVPIDWEVGSRADQEHMRGMLDVVPSLKITALSTFASRDGCVVTVYERPLRAGEGDAYIDKLHSQNEEKFRIGRSRGLVKNVLDNRKIRRTIFDVLLLDWESNRGQLPHERQWVLHTKELPNNIVIVTASCNEQGYRATKDAIDRVASSVTANLKEDAP